MRVETSATCRSTTNGQYSRAKPPSLLLSLDLYLGFGLGEARDNQDGVLRGCARSGGKREGARGVDLSRHEHGAAPERNLLRRRLRSLHAAGKQAMPKEGVEDGGSILHEEHAFGVYTSVRTMLLRFYYDVAGLFLGGNFSMPAAEGSTKENTFQ